MARDGGMKFGSIAIADAEGLILAHSQRAGGRMLKKGRVLSAEDIAGLAANGIAEVTGAYLDVDDLGEDAAADVIAQACCGVSVTAQAAFTGRSNLFSGAYGVMIVDKVRLEKINQIDEAVTIATLAPFSTVEPRRMLATVKIIPFAVPHAVAVQAAALASEGEPLITIAPFRARSVGLVQTVQPDTKESVLDKTAEVIAERLRGLNSSIDGEVRCAHKRDALSSVITGLKIAGRDLILVVGASAITDRRDVIPAAIEAAGGTVEHFGMPVDPGNLLLLGRLDATTPVLGLPGCARSPKFNGVDWVLQRIIADLPLGPTEITAMGSGGLLMDTMARPLPRAEVDRVRDEQSREEDMAPRAPRIAAVLLAAGQSRRMGPLNKLLQVVDGAPMVVCAADALLAAQVESIIVVLGHEAGQVRTVLDGRDITFIENPDYAEGLSTSLRCGLTAIPEDIDAVLICLGDMPRVSAAQINRLIAAFNWLEGRSICLPTHRGKRGNPVLWARQFVMEMMEISGDVGARHLLGEYAELVCEVEMGEDDAVLLDIDTPEALSDATA
jgi:molybdenum cofactor cytidylyltransferase